MPQATVAAMVVRTINGKESVLLTKRNVAPFKGLWCLPGGHIDLYETADIAVFREVKEETGIDYQGSFFGFFEEIFPELKIHNVALAFAGEGTGEPDPAASPAEVAEMQWFPINEAAQLQLAFTHGEVVQAYAKKAGNR
jgi:8-oxo-dGTP diphosphatase